MNLIAQSGQLRKRGALIAHSLAIASRCCSLIKPGDHSRVISFADGLGVLSLGHEASSVLIVRVRLHLELLLVKVLEDSLVL